MARYLQEPSKNGAANLIAHAVEVCEWAGAYPALFEQLSEARWESGKPRVTSTLMLFAEDGVVKGCLHDRELARALWVSADSVTGLFAGLEASLETGRGDWRKDRVQGAHR